MIVATKGKPLMRAYKAIQTKFIPAGNVRGARVKASAAASGSRKHTVTVPYGHELDGVEAHADAVKKLCAKLNWSGKLAVGMLPDGSYAWVFIQDEGVM